MYLSPRAPSLQNNTVIAFVSPALIIGLFSLSWKELWRLSHSARHWGQEDDIQQVKLERNTSLFASSSPYSSPSPSSQCVLWSRVEGNFLLLVSPCVQEEFYLRSLPPSADGTPSPPRPRSLRPSSWWEEWKEEKNNLWCLETQTCLNAQEEVYLQQDNKSSRLWLIITFTSSSCAFFSSQLSSMNLS